MAFNSLSARLDELRSRNPPRLHSENPTGTNTPSFRYSGSFMSPPQSQTPSEQPNLQRRFTTDLSKMQAHGPGTIGQPPVNAVPQDHSAVIFKKAQLLERKKAELEYAAEQRKQYQAQLQYINQQEAREREEIERMTRELHRASIDHGYASEPTTPPEMHEQSYGPASLSGRPNRYSTSSFTSPPPNTRTSRSGSQLTSPPADLLMFTQQDGKESLPSRSVPNSRRGSTDRVSAFVPETNGSARRNGLSNRYSMPVTGLRGKTYEAVPEHSPTMDIEQVNTTSFLFDEDEKSKDNLTSPEVTKYLQMGIDNFPVLNDHNGTLSAASAALDLALAQSPAPEKGVDSFFAKNHRLSLQHNLSEDSLGQANGQVNSYSAAGLTNTSDQQFRQPNRHSMEASLAAYSQQQGSQQLATNDPRRPSLANAHASYSTSDVPTLKDSSPSTNTTPPKNHSQQFHNHNASLGRIPPYTMSNRQSRDLGNSSREDTTNTFQPMHSTIQTSSAPTSISATATSPTHTSPSSSNTMNANASMGFANQPFYAGYGMQLANMSINPMLANQMAYTNPMQLIQQQQQSGFLPYTNYAQQSRFQDGQPRSMQNRRMPHADDQARFSNVKLESLRGEIPSLCKDQHGCRYLQKKLEDRSAPENVQIIFLETYQHVVELMTDPFGNYLCQKLLEFSNDEQRTVLVNNAAPEMVKIALNSHGTRALQKMIEFISTSEQIQTIINALKHQVVELIQDLNGNHVIQKCLNRLDNTDAQFIFDAVGIHCVAVGTHRHGCCVLQRCIDHASGGQKARLISQITEHAYHLVQDPFGNYVLQYIVDLQEPCFTDPLCHVFRGQIPQLSKQKFSSNVIEKCLRGADPSVTKLLIEEMLNPVELEKMLRDQYANYVVQTAMDYADAETKARLIDQVRPQIAAIRHTPHGRRIQTKLMGLDGHGRFSGSGTPNERASGQVPLSLQMSTNTPFNYNQGNSNFNAAIPAPYPSYGSGQAPVMNSNTAYSHLDSDNLQNVHQPATNYRLPQVHGGFF